MLEWWVGRGNPAVDPKSFDDLFANETPQQQIVRGQRDMRTAKETAEYVALKRLGFDAQLTPGDVVIDQIVCLKANEDGSACEQFAPSDKVLDPGDQLSKLDGVSLSVVDDLVPVLAKHKPGDKVLVEYERDGKPGSGGSNCRRADSRPHDRRFRSQRTAKISLLSDVKIGTTRCRRYIGWSAFTLTLIDQLSQGDLMGGKDVAVTGTIGVNGEVGAIGGLAQKSSAVLQSGAKYFLVPTAQGPADIARARAVVGDAVEIIPVATVDEALAALQRIGGDPAPAVETPATTDSTATTAP
jgi:PDZ domain-containing protein